MKIKITSDSTCDLSAELLERYQIGILPLSVLLGEASRKDGVDMNSDEIYAYVESTGSLPKTSAVNVEDYIEAFGAYVADGCEVVHISISADFSSCYQNACIAAQEVGHVHVVDSRNLSTGQGLVVLKAAELAAAGKTPEEICRACVEMTDRVEASFIIDRLDYLFKGGRCSALSALGANLLKIKPCIVVKDGTMHPEKKYRGLFEKVLLHYVEDRLKDRTDIEKDRIFITHSKCDPECVKAVADAIRKWMPDFKEIIETDAGSTVCTHCGPNTLGILFVRNS